MTIPITIGPADALIVVGRRSILSRRSLPSAERRNILVPSRTPRDIVVRLNQEIGDVIRALTNVETLLASQALVPASDTPEEFEEFIHVQVSKWAKVFNLQRRRSEPSGGHSRRLAFYGTAGNTDVGRHKCANHRQELIGDPGSRWLLAR
jgi:hypothetical protein